MDRIKHWKSLPEYKTQYNIHKYSNSEVLQNSLEMLLLKSEEVEEDIVLLNEKLDALTARRVAICDLKRKLENESRC